jgi:hypothetical protein
VALVLALVAAVTAAQEKRDRPRRGETLVVTGCIERDRIASHTIEITERKTSWDGAVTFRMTGDKKIVNTLKGDHEGHIEIVTGVLRSELPVESNRRIGNTTIGMGLPGRNAPPMPSYPVLDVKSAEHTDKSCER